MSRLSQAATAFGIEWRPNQLPVFEKWNTGLDKMLVHYPTGKGKTKLMLACMYLRELTEVLVIAPPSTHPKWVEEGAALGITVNAISHAKFREPGYKLSRHMPVIVDEFHLLGGHTGIGWKKMDRFASSLMAPMIIGSATPNYNDAERVYCICHVMDPLGNRGGFTAWIFQHCTAIPSRYSAIPEVQGFIRYADANEFLGALPYVAYLPDDAPDIVTDVDFVIPLGSLFEDYNLDQRNQRIMASMMEKRHQRRIQQVTTEHGTLRDEVLHEIHEIVGDVKGAVIIYATHSTIAEAAAASLAGAQHVLVTGDTSYAQKAEAVKRFNAGEIHYMISTATLATGTDGMDKVCDTLIILDDTDDDSLRRQLVGRILPRGDNDRIESKTAPRFVYHTGV